MKISEEEFNARYKKIRKIGEGTSSSVYLYKDVIDGKEVAVKVLSSAIQEDY
jgi:serine/threonine protein kinase